MRKKKGINGVVGTMRIDEQSKSAEKKKKRERASSTIITEQRNLARERERETQHGGNREREVRERKKKGSGRQLPSSPKTSGRRRGQKEVTRDQWPRCACGAKNASKYM